MIRVTSNAVAAARELRPVAIDNGDMAMAMDCRILIDGWMLGRAVPVEIMRNVREMAWEVRQAELAV